MLLLGERFQKRFPKLLTEDYHPDDFLFRATDTERSQKSQAFFARGLFGRFQKVQFQDSVLPHDPTIRYENVNYFS